MGISEFDDGFDDAHRKRPSEEREERRLGEAILSAQIRQLDPRPAVSVTESTSIGDAIQRMLDEKIGAVLIVRDGRAVGIFTERDVLQRVAISGIDRSRPVSEVMTPSPEVLGLDDGIAFALNRMIARGYRHVPIVDKADRPVAVLSVREVVAYIVSLLPARVHNLPPEPKLAVPKTLDGG
jgi:CBS domain-containing protein